MAGVGVLACSLDCLEVGAPFSAVFYNVPYHKKGIRDRQF